MTFIPSAQPITDNNNSTTSTTNPYTGVWTSTNGYEGISININCNVDSSANGLIIQFSPNNGTTVSKSVSDTVFGNIVFTKNYKVLDSYYRISFTASSAPSTQIIISRLLTGSSNENVPNNFYDSNDSDIDAFGKLRVSNPYTLLEVKFPSGTGTTEFLNNTELVCTRSIGSYTSNTPGNGTRTISGTGVGIFTSQSRKYCTYLPGKSTLVLCSGLIYNSSNVSMTARIGYYDDNNGFYFQHDGSSISIVVKNSGVITNIASQSSWNIDPMNGSGSSSLNLDFTKAQLFVIDFEWLGVGRIRFGFYAFGRINYCHQITNINALTAPYMPTANLPIRYELSGSSAGSSGSMVQICSTVISEGGYNPVGRPFTTNNGLPASNNVASSETFLLAIKGISTYNHENVIPLGVQLLNSANTTAAIQYRIRLFLAPTADPITGGSFTWTNVNNYSIIQSTSATSGGTVNFTGSIVVEEGYFTGRGTSEFNGLSDVFTNLVQITSDILGNSDILMITAQIQTGNAQVACQMQWQEVY